MGKPDFPLLSFSQARKGDVIAVMIENRSELIATIVGLAKIGVTIALVNTSQVGKVLAHSINLVKPIAVIAGEEVELLLMKFVRT